MVYSIANNRKIRKKNKQIERVNAELNHLNAHLESIVDARTQELQLALKKAEESDRLKSAFLANMSHEVRTPLNGLLGFARLLDDDNLPSNIRKQYIEIMQLRGSNLTRIINDIISISQIEVGQLEIKKSPTNINRLLASLFTIFDTKEMSRRKDGIKLNLVRTLSDSRSNIITDPIRLEQILFNIIDNAFKFTDEGTVEFGYQMDSNKSLKFFVKDTGSGIPVEQQSKIFTRFNRFDNPYISSASGSGLGLSICKGLVELLDGTIWFESVPEKGTTFYFTIPYITAGETAETSQHFSPGKVDFSGKVILVVEDDLISYQLVEALLKDTNVKLIHVKNGEDAVEICQFMDCIDLVIMDMRLPFLNGYEATSRIKKINPKLTIIAQTANVLSDDRARCLSIGCSDYIAKPIDPDEFMRTIASHLLDAVAN
jgi:signal transduction histidine kinase/CheY-like chemotaxis protein